jgi:methylated-DNA-[protein]-cysteine S-methyltransferase
MTGSGLVLFDTAIGRCGIAWSGRGVAAVQLPEIGETGTRARLLRRVPGARASAPPAPVRAAVDAIVALLRGDGRDLRDIELDMACLPAFDRRVYVAARAIPPGTTRRYGELAATLGDPAAAREVGRALARNPFAIVVPCHRVVAAGGRPGGFSARGGVALKLRLLAIEGARAADGPLALFDGRWR